MVEVVYFWNIFLYCKIIISFLELFSVTCFLCILQSQLTRRNTSIPKKLKKRQHMTFVMTSSNAFLMSIFLSSLFFIYIVNTVYVQSFM